jgi:hypothetical protein
MSASGDTLGDREVPLVVFGGRIFWSVGVEIGRQPWCRPSRIHRILAAEQASATAEKGKAKAAKRQARDDAYRAALGLAKGAKLPNSIGTMPATGGGRNRRGRVTGGIGQSTKQAGAARSRVKLIG